MEMELYKHEHAEGWQKFLLETDVLKGSANYYRSKYSRPCGNIHSSLMLLKENGRIIGQLSSLVDHAWLRNRVVTIRTLVDLYVKPEFPGYGLHLLLRYLSRFPDNVFVCFPNQQAAPLYQKLGWRNISSIFKRYFFPIDIKYLSTLRFHYRIPGMANAAFRCVLHSYLMFQKLRTRQDHTYEIFTDVGKFLENDGIRQLWTEPDERVAEFATSVTPEHFKIYGSPLLKKVLFISVFDREKRPKAACVVVFDQRMHAEITDYAGHTGALRYLFVVALEAVIGLSGKILVVNSSVDEHASVLKGLLFRQAGGLDAYLYSSDPELRAEVNQVGSLFISSGIGDNWF